MDLGGFMIVEGSETVRLGNQVMQKDVDYTIDYFTGKINFISEDALNPGAEISVSFEENELISFDQKLLAGTYAKYEFGEKNYLAGGMFYYNQAIAEEKVDIGYEPMRNFAWNISGKYQNEWGLLTRAVDFSSSHSNHQIFPIFPSMGIMLRLFQIPILWGRLSLMILNQQKGHLH